MNSQSRIRKGHSKVVSIVKAVEILGRYYKKMILRVAETTTTTTTKPLTLFCCFFVRSSSKNVTTSLMYTNIIYILALSHSISFAIPRLVFCKQTALLSDI